MAGTNQECFEVSLNTSYANCRRYVQPMTVEEVDDFRSLHDVKYSLNDCGFYCNNVPGEVVAFSKADNIEMHVAGRTKLFGEVLHTKLSKMSATHEETVGSILESIFVDCTFTIMAIPTHWIDVSA